MGISANRQIEIDYYLSKKNLEEYLQIYSANYIATKLFAPDFTTTAGTVIDRAKKFGIPTHNISGSCFLKNTKELKKQTCQKKYGVDNPSQAQEIKNKKEQAALDKYGVVNVFQAEEIKQKSRETCLEKYGCEQVGRLSEFRSKGKRSKFHQQIEHILEKYNITYESEVGNKFKTYNYYYNKDYSPIVDILIEDYKIVIECQGDFWHANPIKYKESDTFDTFEGRKTAKELWQRDKARKEQIESFGYIVIVIWESELNHNRQDVEKSILNAINKIKKSKKDRKSRG